MPDDLLIRPAVPADTEAVRRVLIETWHDTYDALLGPMRVEEITERWHAADLLAAQIGLASASFLVAERAGTCVGHAFGREPEAGVLVLARLYVLPAWQRQEIGARLLAKLVERYPGTAAVQLQVEADNSKGVAFYRREGFVVTGEVTQDGVRTLRMVKAIR